jgi:hypothetical protein
VLNVWTRVVDGVARAMGVRNFCGVTVLEPHRRNISPQLLSAIQCVRRWRRAGLGTYQSQGNTTVKDEELDLLYGVQSWANSSFNGDDNSNDCSV